MIESGISDNKLSSPQKLPFLLNENSFSDWLGGLDLNNKVGALSVFLSTLKMLSQIKLSPQLRVIFVNKISAHVYPLVQHLLTTYIKSSFPFDKQDKLKADLSISCAHQISLNYVLLCEKYDLRTSPLFNEQQKSFLIYSGLYAQSQVLLFSSLLYQKPGKGFWQRCYLFHLIAKQNAVLDTLIKSEKNNFLSLFKQILVFELSNTGQFNTEEIVAIFELLKKTSHCVELLSEVPRQKFKGIPYINLRSDVPPLLPQKNDQKNQPYLLHISCLPLIKLVLNMISSGKAVSSTCSKQTLMRLMKTLTMNQQRKSERQRKNEELFVQIGFDEIVVAANNASNSVIQSNAAKLDKISSFALKLSELQASENSRNKDDLNFRSEHLANFSILQKETQDNSGNVKNTDIWAKKDDREEDISLPTANAELLDQSRTGFRLSLKGYGVKSKIGDIIGLTLADAHVVTIIRRIIQARNNEIQIGLEVLGHCTGVLLLINLDGARGISGLHLDKQKDTESIIIKSQEYHNETFLFADTNERVTKYTVKKQLNASSSIKHLKISLS